MNIVHSQNDSLGDAFGHIICYQSNYIASLNEIDFKYYYANQDLLYKNMPCTIAKFTLKLKNNEKSI